MIPHHHFERSGWCEDIGGWMDGWMEVSLIKIFMLYGWLLGVVFSLLVASKSPKQAESKRKNSSTNIYQ